MESGRAGRTQGKSLNNSYNNSHSAGRRSRGAASFEKKPSCSDLFLKRQKPRQQVLKRGRYIERMSI
jgi:hypothetical protein